MLKTNRNFLKIFFPKYYDGDTKNTFRPNNFLFTSFQTYLQDPEICLEETLVKISAM